MRSFKKMFIANNRSHKKFKPMGLALHETATPGAPALNEYKYFNNNKGLKKSAHAFIDWTEDLQLIPWDEMAWHAKPQGNKRYIGIEMCRPKADDPKRLEKMLITYEATVDAFARVMHYVLKIKTVTDENVTSHDEISRKYKESNHTDPVLYLKEIGKDLDIFRAAVQTKLDILNQ